MGSSKMTSSSAIPCLCSFLLPLLIPFLFNSTGPISHQRNLPLLALPSTTNNRKSIPCFLCFYCDSLLNTLQSSCYSMKDNNYLNYNNSINNFRFYLSRSLKNMHVITNNSIGCLLIILFQFIITIS